MAIYDFEQWISLRKEIQEDFASPNDPVDRFKFNKDHDTGEDYEKVQKEVTKVVMAKYQRQFLKFLNDLSQEHSDGELRNLLRKLETDNSSGSANGWKPEHPSNSDDIVPPEADRGIDPNSDE